MASSLVFLFLSDLFHQILFYIGGVLALLELFMTKWLNTPLEKKLFNTLVIGCLFIACFQAWVDEHHNGTELIREKSNAVGEREFWKAQSYAKDEAIRQRDNLLEQNFTTLSGTQQALASVSTKILEITKPEPVKITSMSDVIKFDAKRNHAQILVFSNKPIPAKVIIACQNEMSSITAHMAGVRIDYPLTTNQAARNIWYVDIPSPLMGPSSPLSLILGYDEDSLGGCQVTRQ
jgi:hypothetical protein